MTNSLQNRILTSSYQNLISSHQQNFIHDSGVESIRPDPNCSSLISTSEPMIPKQRCSAYVAELVSAGFPTLEDQAGRVLHELAMQGTFKLGGVVVGTQAFRVYSTLLGAPLEPELICTDDIDIASTHEPRLDGLCKSINLDEALRRIQLTREPPSEQRSGKATRWFTPDGEALLEFLTPRQTKHLHAHKLPALGVYAEALSYMDYLIHDPIPAIALFHEGILVMVPQLERFIVHKLIVSQCRIPGAEAKASKDLHQALELIRYIPQWRMPKLKSAVETAMRCGRSWSIPLKESLRGSPQLWQTLTG